MPHIFHVILLWTNDPHIDILNGGKGACPPMCKKLGGVVDNWVKKLDTDDQLALIRVADYYGSKTAIGTTLEHLSANIRPDATDLSQLIHVFKKHKQLPALVNAWLRRMQNEQKFSPPRGADDDKNIPAEFWCSCVVLGVDTYPIQVAAFVFPQIDDISEKYIEKVASYMYSKTVAGRKNELDRVFAAPVTGSMGRLMRQFSLLLVAPFRSY